jgi:predicted lipoprotein with Yx(FWY)xxD motif
MSKRLRRLGLYTAIATAVAVPAIAVAATTTTLTTHNVKRGTVVASPSGLTLYGFAADKNGKPTCYNGCAVAWPPLIAGTNVAVKAGSGLSSKLVGRVKRTNGTFQVTYGGKPLYRYAGDKKPGTQNGQNRNQFGARWYVIGKGGGYLKPVGSGLIGGY